MRTPWFAALCLVLLVGCDRRVQQCNRLIDAINEEQPKLSKSFRASPTPEPTPEALDTFAKRLDELGAKIKRIELKDGKLVAYRDGYAKLATDIATAARKTAAAFEDRKEAAKAAAELNSFKENEKTLVKQINEYCQGKGG